MSQNIVCVACQKSFVFTADRVGLREECPYCGADLHACRQCEFHDVKAYNECRESSADRVQDKERANFCDYYSLKKDGSAAKDRAAELRAAAEALFKKS